MEETKNGPEKDQTEQVTMTEVENVLRRHMKGHDPNEKVYAKHRLWMSAQQREFPLPMTPYRIGAYIRYHNQTEHENYLEYHKQRYRDDVALCPNWTLVDFYVDTGAKPPRMENSPEWCRLLTDCFNGKVDLIITQNISFISRDPDEMILLSRLLAGQEHPVGIYCISEDVFTLASYFKPDLFEELEWDALPPDEFDCGMEEIPKIEGSSIHKGADDMTNDVTDAVAEDMAADKVASGREEVTES